MTYNEIVDLVREEFETIKATSYILTDKAFYMITNGKYKSTKRIALEDIIVVEKSEYYCDGYFAASEKENIHIINTKNDSELFIKITELIK